MNDREEDAVNESQGRLSHCATVLLVHDMGRSRAFYRDVLGFSVEFEWEDPPTYAVLRSGDRIQLHLSLLDDPAPEGARPTILYIFVHDVDALHAQVVEGGCTVNWGPTTAEYGMREFEMTDPDGHRLTFGQGV